MKINIVATSCLVAFVGARPQGSIEKDAEWTVKDLVVSAIPAIGHSLHTSYSFTVVTSTQTAECKAESQHGGAPLGTIPKTACTPAQFAFSWTPNGEFGCDGATLEIFNSITQQHAIHNITDDEIRRQRYWVLGSHPSVYNGPTEFVVETQLD